MGTFSEADFAYKILESGVVHITDHNLGAISVTNDAEDVLLRVHREIDLTDKKVQYVDSEGQVDRLLHEKGVFKGFAAGPWSAETRMGA